jgi:transglutaminase-like putative cysteine protease
MNPRTALSILLLAIPAITLGAATTVVSTDVVYELAADGSWTVDRTTVVRINEQAAVQPGSQQSLQYSDSLQTLEVVEAYTTTKDGQRVDVAPDRILTQQLPASTGAPTFSDYKVKNVVFPQVEVGATMTLHSRFKQLRPFLPGVFSGGESYNRLAEITKANLTLRAPENMQVYVFARNVQGGPVNSTTPGVREWRWTHGPAKAETPEPGSVAPASISPGVMFSTLKDYPALADAYMIGASQAAKVTPKVQQQADTITNGITDRRAQASAIYRWVASEIRYVAIAMGTGGYVPHGADEIIDARYGDCKDKTTLLTSLLAAKGIRALPVLINAADRYHWQEVPLLSAFNHAIAYLPDFDLYLDGTVALAPFDALPDALRGRPVLVTGDARAKAAVRATPDMDPAKDHIKLRTDATVLQDGSVTGTTSLEAFGAQDGPARTTFSAIPVQLLPMIGKQLLALGGQTGDAKLTLGDLRDFSQPKVLAIEFSSPGLVNLPGPGALTTSYGLQGLGIKSFVSSMNQIARTMDFPCPAGGTEEALSLTLPAGMKITSIPAAANVESAYGRFTSSAEVRDGKLLVTQKLDVKRPHMVCTAADHVELRKFATAIDRELRKQILYQ